MSDNTLVRVILYRHTGKGDVKRVNITVPKHGGKFNYAPIDLGDATAVRKLVKRSLKRGADAGNKVSLQMGDTIQVEFEGVEI